jgi:hypothetical protein
MSSTKNSIIMDIEKRVFGYSGFGGICGNLKIDKLLNC